MLTQIFWIAMEIEKKSNTFDVDAFRPSSLNRFLNCNLASVLPQVAKTESQLAYLKERSDDHSRLEKERFLDSEGECYTQYYISKELCKDLCKEKRLEMEIEGEVFGGTPDVFGFEEEKQTLHILDFKTGVYTVHAGSKGKPNTQLLAYAMLIQNSYPNWKIKELKLSILNTQKDYVHTYTVEDAKSSIEKLKKTISERVLTAKKGAIYSKAGDHCVFCSSKAYCPLKRDYKPLKKVCDMQSDELILEVKKRRGEILRRESAVKSKEEYSEILTPLLKERTLKRWKTADLPEKFKTLKPMNILEAERAFGFLQVEQYTEKTTSCYIGSAS